MPKKNDSKAEFNKQNGVQKFIRNPRAAAKAALDKYSDVVPQSSGIKAVGKKLDEINARNKEKRKK
jgi:hypothetical protein